LYEAVDFFVKHGAKKGNPIIEDVVQEFLKDKQQVGRKGKYLEGLQDKWTKFIDHVGEGKHLADITTEKIRDYIFVTRKELSDTTKSDYLRGLSILFNYGIKKKYLSLNPVVGVERPQLKYRPPEVLSPEDFTSLLNRCLKRKWFDRLTVFILVGFCGVRTEEACQLRWDNIDMSAKKVLVPAEIAKKAHFRRNGIPSNAMKWLKLCHDRRKTGPIIGANAKQQLSTAIRFAHIGYTQNCLRHSFCSYSLESGIPLADVAASLGHTESLQVLHTHYRNIVEPKTAKAWWAIVP
jgi:integrase